MNFLRPLFRSPYRALRAGLLRGNRFACPLCGGRFSRLLTKGYPARPNAMCPRCFSLERHRLLWLYLNGGTADLPKLAAPCRMLHIAPEPALEARFRALPLGEYRTADREIGRADEAFDLTAIPHADNRFDFILCCHVLEHIPDDKAALGELHRVLAAGGILWIQVPLGHGPTLEDERVISPEMRSRYFGQEDHVRLYGYDLADRMRQAGFEVSVEKPWDMIPESLRSLYRLAPDGEAGEPVFVARK